MKRKIEILDRQIDQLVYQLYGLTEEEIKVVEGSVTSRASVTGRGVQ